ncbi:MAG: fibrobacter succinogenes major paralogous domain-containing protein [Chitinophagales bacterium]|nr:fibrobacter succinogenes major paralogous domain-containing protein [Chitinophagales bacterium]
MKKSFQLAFFILLTATVMSCKKDKESEDSNPPKNNPYLNPNLKYGSVTDIDGNKYATIEIGATKSGRTTGTQVWMAENLRVTRYNDGTTIPHVTDDGQWEKLAVGAYSVYDNSSKYDEIYGKLYNWYAVETDKLCPEGWHIPTDYEWDILEAYLGDNVGGQMKSTNDLGYS